MALIKCTECGKEISDSAVACPNCGCKTTHGRKLEEAKTREHRSLAVNITYTALDVIGAFLFFPGIIELTNHGYSLFDNWARGSDSIVTAGMKCQIGILLMAIGFIGPLVYHKFFARTDLGNGATSASDNAKLERAFKNAASAPSSSRKTCPHCGNVVTSNLCDMCGKNIQSADTIPTRKRIQQEQDNDSCWICSGCGRKNLATRTTCWNCNRHV